MEIKSFVDDYQIVAAIQDSSSLLQAIAGELDVMDIAGHIDLGDLAGELDISDHIDLEDLADNISTRAIAECFDADDIATEIDLDDLSGYLVGQIFGNENRIAQFVNAFSEMVNDLVADETAHNDVRFYELQDQIDRMNRPWYKKIIGR